MRITRQTGNWKGRRRLTLLLLAVVAPSLALIALSLRMISQEGRLSESRLAEGHAQAIREFGQMVILTADRYRSEATSSQDLPDEVILIGLVEAGRLLLPWQIDAQLGRTAVSAESVDFARRLAEAERLEFGAEDHERTIRAYGRAVAAAGDSVEQAYAELYLSRALQKAGRASEAREIRRRVITKSIGLVDEFAIPFAFYAARSLEEDRREIHHVIEMLRRVSLDDTRLSPQAGFLLRSIVDTVATSVSGSSQMARFEAISGPVSARAAEAIKAGRLQEDFDHINALLAASGDGENSESRWTIYGEDEWLVGVSEQTDSPYSLAVVLDAGRLSDEVARRMQLAQRGYETPVLTAAVSPVSQWLGPSLPGVHLILSKTDGSSDDPGLELRYAFILLAMILVVGLAALGAFLWWRDTKRELHLVQMRSDFVSSVSHELKTPLTSIQMFTETLRFREPSEEARRKYLDTILSESGRLTRLLNNVLDFSKIEKGSKQYSFELVSLQDVIDSALRALAYPLQAKSFSVTTDLPEDEIVVSADRDALEQVILNLLSNAMKFSGTRTEIAITLEKNDSMAVLAVQDYGFGIEADEIDQIFDRFYRSHEMRHRGIPGTGLGLSIVQHAIEAHDGSISVTSKPGAGSTFTIQLPLIEQL